MDSTGLTATKEAAGLQASPIATTEDKSKSIAKAEKQMAARERALEKRQHRNELLLSRIPPRDVVFKRIQDQLFTTHQHLLPFLCGTLIATRADAPGASFVKAPTKNKPGLQFLITPSSLPSAAVAPSSAPPTTTPMED